MNEELIFVKDFVINTINDTNYWLKHEDSLKRRVIVECRVNLALLDMAMWKDVSNQFKYYLIGQLQTEAIELAIECSNKNILKSIFNVISTGENEIDSGYTYSIIISKIKALKVIANIPEELSDDNKSRLNSRITNLKEQVHSLLVKLETK